MPVRLWRLPKEEINWQQKRLLAYVWWCAPNGMRLWNCRLAKTYGVTERTIRRWISNLHKYELIAIRYGDGANRVIFPRYQARRPKTGKDGAAGKPAPAYKQAQAERTGGGNPEVSSIISGLAKRLGA